MFHLRFKENLVKHQKVSKYYKNDCRHILYLQVRPDHDLIYYLNLLKDVSFFTFSGSAFHICGLSALKLLLPYFSVLWFSTS